MQFSLLGESKSCNVPNLGNKADDPILHGAPCGAIKISFERLPSLTQSLIAKNFFVFTIRVMVETSRPWRVRYFGNFIARPCILLF